MTSSHQSSPLSAALLQQLETSLESKLRQQLSQQHREQEILLKRLLETALSQLSDTLEQSLSLAATGAQNAPTTGASAESKLGNAIARLINHSISAAFSGHKTRTSTQETQRSKDAATLTTSRSQRQALQATETQRGSHNL